MWDDVVPWDSNMNKYVCHRKRHTDTLKAPVHDYITLAQKVTETSITLNCNQFVEANKSVTR